ncbi:MAG: flagellar motor protein MotD [Zoogloeaceae bacterium]|nr:flagellar motor protein MotD [Rhodocyclaceae bacterium]MCP5237856.1 flagellar motor protein MotD [Zoogloeaceae bacterium]
MARRRQFEEEHENHERWLVSYADFITLLFAFFVVMYAISSVNEGKYRVLSDSIVQAFRSVNVNAKGSQIVVPPTIMVATQAGPPSKTPESDRDRAIEARREALSKKMRNIADEIKQVLEPLARDGQVRVTEGAHGITVEINASVLFQIGEASIGDGAGRALTAVAQVLAGADFPITIEGHTDDVPISTPRFPSNWELSAVRASSVVRLFVDAGVEPSRLTAAGYGDQRPVADNRSEAGRARNRRVNLLIESLIDDYDADAPVTRADIAHSILPTGNDR